MHPVIARSEFVSRRLSPPARLVLPISNKNIDVARLTAVAVAAEHDFFPVRAEHGKCIKAFVAAYFFQPVTIDVGQIHVERKSPGVFMVGAKNNPFAVREKIWRPVGLTIRSDLFSTGSIRVGG